MTHPDSKNINFSSEVIWGVLAPEHHFLTKYKNDFQNLYSKNISSCFFNFWPQNCFFSQNRLQRLRSWGLDASLDTYIDGLCQLWRLWQLWPYPQFGHYGIMAITAIDAIVDRHHRYGCLMKRLDLRIATSEADFA